MGKIAVIDHVENRKAVWKAILKESENGQRMINNPYGIASTHNVGMAFVKCLFDGPYLQNIDGKGVAVRHRFELSAEEVLSIMKQEKNRAKELREGKQAPGPNPAPRRRGKTMTAKDQRDLQNKTFALFEILQRYGTQDVKSAGIEILDLFN